MYSGNKKTAKDDREINWLKILMHVNVSGYINS